MNNITAELRAELERYDDSEPKTDVVAHVEYFLDAIDSIHANLESENEALRKAAEHPAAECETIRRLEAECRTQRNNFEQAASAREHWKRLCEAAQGECMELMRKLKAYEDDHDEANWLNAELRAAEEERDELQKELDHLTERGNKVIDVMERKGWVELPKDADGQPLHFGDKFTVSWSDKVYEVAGFSYTQKLTSGEKTIWVDVYDPDKQGNRPLCGASSCHHVKPDTWERIIDDARTCTSSNGTYTSIPSMRWTSEADALVARCKALAGDES